MATLRLNLLGAFEAFLGDDPITHFRSINNQGLLVYLALNSGNTYPREVLATLIWPDITEQSAHHNLRQALYHLRHLFGDTQNEGEPALIVTRQTAQFNPQRSTEIDVRQFLRAVEGHDLESAVALYKGDLLPGFSCDSLEFEEWLRLERESLHQVALAAMTELTREHLAARSLERAQALARRQLSLEPWREVAFRQLMEAYAQAGDRANALATYDRCREILWAELGVEPDEVTTGLHTAIESGSFGTTDGDISLMTKSVRHNLPGETTSFIGRQDELTKIQHLLLETDCRLLTLVGLGGMGKTRTAVEAARTIAAKDGEFFPDGVRFVTFAPVDNRESALRSLADALDYQLAGGEVPQDKQLLTVLSMKKLLLLMDNLEHLLGQGMDRLLDDILATAPGVKLLATSRERVNLRAETVLILSGMDDAQPFSIEDEALDEDGTSDAIRLFVQSVRRTVSDFRFNQDNAGDIATICRLCGGMPLAIELAAGWLGVLSPREVVAELVRSLDILSTNMRDIPERQRSLRAVFDGSWQRLSAPEQKAFLRLSVFRGGFQRAQGEAATGISLPILLSLVNKSFLQREADGRFGLHEQIRSFANERLHEDKQAWREAKEAHSRAYAAFMTNQFSQLLGQDQVPALGEIDCELDNIRVAWEWLVAQEKFNILVQQMLPGLVQFATIRMRQADIKPLLQEALNKVKRLDGGEISLNHLILQTAVIEMHLQELSKPPFIFPDGRQLMQPLWPAAMAHHQGAGAWFDWFLRNYQINVGGDETFQQWEKHIVERREKGDQWHLAYSLRSYAGALRFHDRDRTRPFELLEEALRLFQQLGDGFSTAEVLYGFGWMSSWAGKYEQAVGYFERAEALMKSIGADVHRGRMLFEIHACYIKMSQPRKAFHFLIEEQAVYRRVNRLDYLKGSLGWESINAGRLSNLDHAFRTRHESMALGRTIARAQGRDDGQYQHIDWDYFELGELYRVAGDLIKARQSYDKAETLFRSSDNKHGIVYSQRAKGDLALAEKQFGQAAFHFQIYLEQGRNFLFFVDTGTAHVGLGRAFIGQGRYQESREQLGEAFKLLDNPAAVEHMVWPILALAELRAGEQKFFESSLLAAFVIKHQLSWLEMRSLAEGILQEIKPHLDPDFDLETAARTAEDTVILELNLTYLPPLN